MNKKYLPLTSKTLQDHNAATVQELWIKAQAEGYEGLSATCSVELTQDEETKKFHAVFSSDAEDRHGDVVHQNFDLKAFKKNPVFLDSHNYGSIEHIIGRIASIGVREGKLQGEVEFALDNPKGLLAQNLASKGFLNTTSIGFIPKDFDEKGNPTKSELLEISAVSVPANPEALFEKQETIISEDSQNEPAPQEAVPLREEAPRVDARRAAADAIRNLKAQREKELKRIARELQTIRDPQIKKRKTYQTIRALLKETDIAA